MMDRTVSPQKLALFAEVCELFKGNDAPTQCNRVREVLQRGYPLSTFEASRWLGVYYCPARVLELRQEGMNILTNWTVVESESGTKHRVGDYLLVREVPHAA